MRKKQVTHYLIYLILCSSPIYGQSSFSTINSFDPKGQIAATSSLDLTKKWDRFTGADSVFWACQGPWVLKNGEKFFAIGIWNIPGYEVKKHSKTDPDIDPVNKAEFEAAAELFNLIWMKSGDRQPYMQPYYSNADSTTFLTGNSRFKWRFQSKPEDSDGAGYNVPNDDSPIRLFVDGIPISNQVPDAIDLNKDSFLSYGEMQLWRTPVTTYPLVKRYYEEQYIPKSVIDDIQARFGTNSNYIWLLADEPNKHFNPGSNGKAWYLPPELLQLYHDAVKTKTGGAGLTFVDLFGSIKGDVYSFEKKHLLEEGPMPATLAHIAPFDEEAIAFPAGDTTNYATFEYTADGALSVHTTYDGPNGKWKRQSNADLRLHYYNNIREAAKAYAPTADILGLNAYTDFMIYPEAAGIAVDALREGGEAIGDTNAVWLFFDGAPKDRIASHPNGDHTTETYIKNVRAQVYTAIVHGVTGVLFWSQEDLVNPDSTNYNPEYWDSIKLLATQLQEKSELFKGTVLHRGVMSDTSSTAPDNMLHFAVYLDNFGFQNLIVTNTDTTQSRESTFRDTLGFSEVKLKGLEVKFIAPYWSGTLTHNEEWQDTIRVRGDITVPENVILTIKPGTVVEFSGAYDYMQGGTDPTRSELRVFGTLEADSATFTHDPSDALDWGGIRIYETVGGQDSYIKSSIIEHAIEGVQIESSNWMLGGDLIADENIIRNCQYGVYIKSPVGPQAYSGNSIRNALFHDNVTGVHIEDAPNTAVQNCLILVKEFENGIWVTGSQSTGLQLFNNTLDNKTTGISSGIVFTDQSYGTIKNMMATNFSDDFFQSGISASSSADTSQIEVLHYLSHNNSQLDLGNIPYASIKAIYAKPAFFDTTSSINYRLVGNIDEGYSPGLDMGDGVDTHPTTTSDRDLGRYGDTDSPQSDPGTLRLQEYYVDGQMGGFAEASNTAGTWTSAGGYLHVDVANGNDGWITRAAKTVSSPDTAFTLYTRMRFSGNEGKIILQNADTNEDFRIDLMASPSRVRLVTNDSQGTPYASPSNPSIESDTWYDISLRVQGDSLKYVRVYKGSEQIAELEDYFLTNDFIPDGKFGLGTYDLAVHSGEFDYFLVVNGVESGPATKLVATKSIPNAYALLPNYPNPFNPETLIRYTIPNLDQVNLEIYDVLGQRIRTLVQATQEPGFYEISWNGHNQHDQSVATGIYFYRLTTASHFSATRKMLLLR